MFLVAGRAGTILHHVRLVKAVLLMASLALAVNCFDGNAVTKTIAQNFAELPTGGAWIVTFFAIVRELGVRGRDFAGVKKGLATPAREKKNRDQAAHNSEQTDNQSRPTPRMQPAVVTEIAFVTLGDLLLRARRFRHSAVGL